MRIVKNIICGKKNKPFGLEEVKMKEKIINWYIKYCYKHKIEPDLFDIKENIDENLSYFENQNIIIEKLKPFLNQETEINQLSKQDINSLEAENQDYINKQGFNIIELFKNPAIIGLIADRNTGKTNLIYYFIERLKKYNVVIKSYGLRLKHDRVIEINSLQELESTKNSIIFIDEMFSLFDLDNRKLKHSIENTLRLINHNNNILFLCGVPENWKKFLSSKLDIIIFKKTTKADLINGSNVKNVLFEYRGFESGTAILDLKPDEAIIYTDEYNKINIPYLERYDTKKGNKPFLCLKRS